MEQLYVTSLTKCELGQIAYMRGAKVDELFEISWKNDKSVLYPKKGYKTIKKVLNMVKK